MKEKWIDWNGFTYSERVKTNWYSMSFSPVCCASSNFWCFLQNTLKNKHENQFPCKQKHIVYKNDSCATSVCVYVKRALSHASMSAFDDVYQVSAIEAGDSSATRRQMAQVAAAFSQNK